MNRTALTSVPATRSYLLHRRRYAIHGFREAYASLITYLKVYSLQRSVLLLFCPLHYIGVQLSVEKLFSAGKKMPGLA